MQGSPTKFLANKKYAILMVTHEFNGQQLVIMETISKNTATKLSLAYQKTSSGKIHAKTY